MAGVEQALRRDERKKKAKKRKVCKVLTISEKKEMEKRKHEKK
jgi:hypothetical protein